MRLKETSFRLRYRCLGCHSIMERLHYGRAVCFQCIRRGIQTRLCECGHQALYHCKCHDACMSSGCKCMNLSKEKEPSLKRFFNA